LVFDNAMDIELNDGKIHTFGSFADRNAVHDLIHALWQEKNSMKKGTSSNSYGVISHADPLFESFEVSISFKFEGRSTITSRS